VGNITRRTFVDAALKSSTLLLPFSLAGETLLLTPRQARAQQVPLRTLSPPTAQILETLGDAILPGAKQAGLVHFLDHQVSVEPNDALLIAKYFQVALPYRAFYESGAKAAGTLAQGQSGKAIAGLSSAELHALLKQMSTPGTMTAGFPTFLFYLCLRSDAVDVVYGTPEGFKKLNIPYMQHILPPEGWNG
jgi:hypothetical protein